MERRNCGTCCDHCTLETDCSDYENINTDCPVCKKAVVVELDMKLLQTIAKYYQFPVAVFFLPEKEWAKGGEDRTRVSELQEKAEQLDKIREILGGDEQ